MLSLGERTECQGIMLDAGIWAVGQPETFASGKVANNKLLFERVKQNDPDGYKLVVHQLGQLLLPYEIEGLWGVPSGGQDLAYDLGDKLDVPVVGLVKEANTAGKKCYRYCSRESEVLAERLQRLAGIEDVVNEFTSFRGALSLPLLAEHTVVLGAAWSRGARHLRQRVAPLPVEALVDDPIPNIIRPHDTFYWRYRHKAVGDLA